VNKAAHLLKKCVVSLDKIEAREQLVNEHENVFQKGKRKWIQEETQARRGLEAEIIRRLQSEAGVYHMEGADVQIYRQYAAELQVNVERSKRLAADDRLAKFILASQESRMKCRADLMQAQEKCAFLEEKIRESKHSYTKLAQATRQVEHYQLTLGTVKDKAIVHKTSALNSQLKLNKLQRKYKTFAKIMSTSQNRKKMWRADLIKAQEKCKSLEEKLHDSQQVSVKLRQATRHLDHVQCTLEKVKFKASVAEESAQDLHCKLTTLRRKRKTWMQRTKRHDTNLTGETSTQRLKREMEVLRSEVLKYEDDFADMQLENGTLREQLEEQHLIIAKMKTFADNPEPRIHFGEAREQYSYDVFRFAAKILNCKLTCKTAHRVTEVFMEEFFPGKAIRIPPPTQWELWRQDMLLAGRYKALKVMRLCDQYHIIGDATTGGTSVSSRKTQIFQTGSVGVKDGKVIN
jgi:hypothetical protein